MRTGFGKDARRAVVRAKDEAVGAGSDHLGCEHLLLALIAERGPAADALTAAGLELASLRTGMRGGAPAGPGELDAEALATVGIDLDAVRRATDQAFGPGALDRPGHGRRGGLMAPRGLSLGADARTSIELAVQATARLRHQDVSAGHLLIGLIDQAANPALDLLLAAGVEPGTVRADVVSRLTAA